MMNIIQWFKKNRFERKKSKALCKDFDLIRQNAQDAMKEMKRRKKNAQQKEYYYRKKAEKLKTLKRKK